MIDHQGIAKLKQAIYSLLCSGERYSEFELIQQLQNPPLLLLDKDALRDDLTLFHTHFQVYHCLYLLQKSWLHESRYLQISALHIQLNPVQSNNVETTEDAKLAAYYLDIDNLTKTTKQDVQALLDDFWLRMSGQIALAPERGQVIEALEYFELDTDEKDWHVIKQQYRKRMHAIHPDKGGDKSETQCAQAHFEVLRLSFDCD